MPVPIPLIGAAPFGKVIQIVVEGLFTEGPSGGVETIKTANVFHYRWNGVNPFATPGKVAVNTSFNTIIGALMIAALSARWTYVRNRIRWLDDATDAYTDFAIGTPGAIAGDCLPPRISVYCEEKSVLRGRNYLGSKHFSPVAESDTTSTELVTPTPAWWTALNTALFTNTLLPAGFNIYVPQVVSATLSQTEVNPTSIVSVDIATAVMRRNLGGMKRRRAKLSTAA